MHNLAVRRRLGSWILRLEHTLPAAGSDYLRVVSPPGRPYYLGGATLVRRARLRWLLSSAALIRRLLCVRLMAETSARLFAGAGDRVRGGSDDGGFCRSPVRWASFFGGPGFL